MHDEFHIISILQVRSVYVIEWSYHLYSLFSVLFVKFTFWDVQCVEVLVITL